jgi:hypothetical protein
MEEIEKAANEIINDGTTLGYFDTFAKYEKTGFIKGAKWQEKRMYSEEEVLELLSNFNTHTLKLQKLKIGNSFNAKEWFNQFKKQ